MILIYNLPLHVFHIKNRVCTVYLQFNDNCSEIRVDLENKSFLHTNLISQCFCRFDPCFIF